MRLDSGSRAGHACPPNLADQLRRSHPLLPR